MSNLKYIKFFESFESTKLSKTLGFIDSKSSNIFLEKIKSICRTIEFPISELSDDVFEYLPFSSALKKNVELSDPEKIPCTYESDWIPGNFCNNGTVERTWGKFNRTIECPVCGGKGYTLPIITYPVGLIKFWFDKDGKWVEVTGTDGKTINDIDDDENEYYSINSRLRISSFGAGISVDKYRSSKSDLRDAHFALILDLGKLKSKSYKKVNVIQHERSLRKSGMFKKNEEIRKENIGRYIDKLISKYNLDDGVKNINRILSVGLSTRPLDYLIHDINTSSLEELITYFYRLTVETSKYRIDDISRNINHYIRKIYNVDYKSSIHNTNKVFIKSYKDIDNPTEIETSRFEVWMKWSDLNKKLRSKISLDIETIEDLEVNWGKILNIKSMLSSNRYNNLRSIRRVTYSMLTNGSIGDSIAYNVSDSSIPSLMHEMSILEKVIDKF